MDLSPSVGRRFVAATRIAAGSILLEEAPAFFFAGPLHRVDMACAALAKMEVDERRVLLEKFSLPGGFATDGKAWAGDGVPPGFPEGATGVERLIHAALKVAGPLSDDEKVWLVLVLVANAHPSGGNGTSLFPQGAVFNHSCDPNVRTRAGPGGMSRIWYAGEDIEEGTELSACYIDQCSPVLMMGHQQRSNYLVATKLFACKCKVCTLEEEAPAPGYRCPACGFDFIPREGGSCGLCCTVMEADESETMRRGEARIFSLILGQDQLAALSDEVALELLDVTEKRYGTSYWPAASLALALLARPSLVARMGPWPLRILARPHGSRRLARVALSSRDQLELCVDHATRVQALKALSCIAPVLHHCLQHGAFHSAEERLEAVELQEIVRKTLAYAVDPWHRSPCCVGCAIANSKLAGREGANHVEEQMQWFTPDAPKTCSFSLEGQDDGDADYEITEQYDDIVL